MAFQIRWSVRIEFGGGRVESPAITIADREHLFPGAASLAPARVSPETAASAVAIAKRSAEALDYVGVFAVEYFVTGRGVGEGLLVNEMA